MSYVSSAAEAALAIRGPTSVSATARTSRRCSLSSTLLERIELHLKRCQVLVGQPFAAQEDIPRRLRGSDELVQLELECVGVIVLRGLDNEDHPERDNGRTGIDYELPGVREVEQWSAQAPHQDHCHGQREGGGPTRGI